MAELYIGNVTRICILFIKWDSQA